MKKFKHIIRELESEQRGSQFAMKRKKFGERETGRRRKLPRGYRLVEGPWSKKNRS